tara:strand:+ start:544 stop:3324 length:2781 start_codon:yes stop_codon:yes gene_type:complete
MAENPYTYADIVVGTKKFPKADGTKFGDGSQNDGRPEKPKVNSDSNNIKKDTNGKKSESATVGDADPNAPKFQANGYSTNLFKSDDQTIDNMKLTEAQANAINNAKSQDENDGERLEHFGQVFNARRPNGLDKYVSKNYLWTLAALSNDEYNFPHKYYKRNGPRADQTVIKMGGFPQPSYQGPMSGGQRPFTELELKNNKANLEYYIDNVDIQSVVAPNKSTRVTTAFAIEFEVMEPYSMGQFLQHLQLCAMKAGYRNYLDCPYLLQLDVVGYTDVMGPHMKEGSRQMAVKIINAQFDVTAGGSKYTIKAVPFNETALIDTNQAIKSNISITGRTIQEMLQTGFDSLAVAHNTDLLETSLKSDNKYEPDEIIILFPTEMSQNVMRDTLADVDNSALFGDYSKNRREYDVDQALSTAIGVDFLENASPGSLKARGNDAEEILKREHVYDRLGYSIKRNNLSEKIKKEFTTSSFTNEIGSTKMFPQGTLTAGQMPFGVSQFAYDEKAKILHRNGVGISPNNKTIQFKQGTKIQRIIEELVLISEYGQQLLNKGQLSADANGMIKWFRIEVQTYVLDAPSTEGKLNKYPKIFVYNVVPTLIHQSVFMLPNDPPPGFNFLKQQAAKEYDYIYTGKNTDILNFDLDFKFAFFQAIGKDFMNRSANNDLSTSGKSYKQAEVSMADASGHEGTPGETVEMVGTVNNTQAGQLTNGAIQESAAVRVSRAFHDAMINGDVDLLSANMTILGDLYFMADSGVGNYFANPTSFININADGTMNHHNGDVDIIINFKTPIDISTGSPTAQGLSDVEEFSGLYQVITVTNSFRGNVYTNELSLVRRKNQGPIDNKKVIREKIFAIKKQRQKLIDAAIATNDPLKIANALADVNANGKIEENERQNRDEYLKKTKADTANFIQRQNDYEYEKASGTGRPK